MMFTNFFNVKKRPLGLVQEEQEALLKRTWVLTIWLALPIITAFNFVDYFLRPEVFEKIYLVRLMMIPVALGFHFCSKYKWLSIGKMTLLLALFFGVEISYVIKMSGYEASTTLRAVNILIIGSLSFLTWQPKGMFYSSLAFVAPTGLVIALKPGDISISALCLNLAFFIFTFLVCSYVYIANRRLRLKAYTARDNLNRLNKYKDQIIERKTRESVNLQKLSRQFPEKTIAAVLDGKVDLDKIDEREITCIFIDIGDSTTKANTLELQEYLQLVDQFINMATEILIEHEITVGTFLGDGIMAFGNAPLDVFKVKEKTLNACFKILEEKDRFESKIKDRWQSSFDVRISITSGTSFCGFYPSGTKGVYSAMGPIVNLSSRLCDLGYKNIICTTTDLVEGLDTLIHESVFDKVDLVERRSIKGFENENLDLCLLSREPELVRRNRICSSCFFKDPSIGSGLCEKCSQMAKSA